MNAAFHQGRRVPHIADNIKLRRLRAAVDRTRVLDQRSLERTREIFALREQRLAFRRQA